MLQINKVFEFDGRLYRVLSITSSNVMWIEIYNDKALPEEITRLEFEELHSNNEIIAAKAGFEPTTFGL